MPDLVNRFYNKVDIRDFYSCWNWKGATRPGRKSTHKAYGHFYLDGYTEGAHRVAWYLNYNYWPNYLLHLCNNSLCVNHVHLKRGTHKKKNMQHRSLSGYTHPLKGNHRAKKAGS